MEVLGRHLQLIMKAVNVMWKEGFSVLKSLFLAALINSFSLAGIQPAHTTVSAISQSVFTQKGHAIKKKKARNTRMLVHLLNEV